MVPNQTFRSALNGFHRADVVNYIEMLNNRHMTELEQLRNQLEAAQARVQELEAAHPSGRAGGLPPGGAHGAPGSGAGKAHLHPGQ